MILYHGTNVYFEEIDLSKCDDLKDFGKGFYTTTLYDQAVLWAKRKAKRFGGNPIVNVYEIDDKFMRNKEFQIKAFKKPTKNWALFIVNNRSHSLADFSSELCNRDLKYDIVYGPVADDTLTTLIKRFEIGFISASTLINEMKYAKPNDQYTFHSVSACNLLKRIDTKWIKE